MKVIISKDNKTVTALAIIGIGLVILITFRNFLLPILLVLIIECAIWINLSVPYFTDIKLVYIAYLILSSIQLGSTVDYAILYSDRYVNFRQTMGKKDAIVKTNQVSITTIITSASILAIAGFCMGFISSNYAISQIGILIGRGTLLSAVAVMGFATKNVDNYGGHIDWPGTEEGVMAIVGHIDVVPIGSGWTDDPFSGKLEEGWLFGRGAQDDKGPTMAGLYAMGPIIQKIPKMAKINPGIQQNV